MRNARPVVSLATTFFSVGLLLTSPVRAEERSPGASVIVREPLIVPEANRAVQRAQQTLRDAHARLVERVDGVEVERIGFLKGIRSLGDVAFRNPLVLYKEADEARTHLGYSFEMKIGDELQRPWVPVVVGRHGAIANRLFSGADSLFAVASGELPMGALSKVASHDLAQRRPLDRMSQWTARRQRGLNGLRPMVVRTGKASAPHGTVAAPR